MTFAILLAAALSGATAYTATFERAVAAEQDGDYATAIQIYEQLVSEGVWEATVFYNLGNVYYESGSIGAAIANYERALHVNPKHTAARHNLDYAVQKTERQWSRPLPPAWEQSILFWHYGWSPRAVYALAMICWVAFWTVLAARLWKPSAYLTRAAVCLALAAAAFATSSYAKSYPQLIAVSTTGHVPVRYGLGESQTQNFELMAGDRVAVDERRDGWAQIQSADGERGWVDEQSLAFVGPPYIRPAMPLGKQAGNGQ